MNTRIKFIFSKDITVALSSENYFTGLQELGNRLNETKELKFESSSSVFRVFGLSRAQTSKVHLHFHIHSHLTQFLKREE